VDNDVHMNGRRSRELDLVPGENGLHLLEVEDAIKAHQHPKPEHHVGTLFLILKSYFAARVLCRSMLKAM
jgi:Mg2+ and Co2+ transporter CorA